MSAERPQGKVIQTLVSLALPVILTANAACDVRSVHHINLPSCKDDPQDKVIESTLIDIATIVEVGGVQLRRGPKPGEFNTEILGKDIVISVLPTGGVIFTDPKTDRNVSISGKEYKHNTRLRTKTLTQLRIETACPEAKST
ncbi:MAG: hypothetical protein AAB583_03570 [Patescibacteria group bacterium]